MENNELLKDAKIYVVDSVTIKPSDVILVKSSINLSMEMTEKIKYEMKRYFPNNKVIVLGSVTDILISRVDK